MGALTGKSAAFLLGFGFALLPAVGPFVAVVVFITSRITLARSDGLWAIAALLYSAPLAISGEMGPAMSGLTQLLAGWLVFRAFASIADLEQGAWRGRGLGAGLVAGLALVIGLSLLNVESWNFATAKTIAQAIVWESSPALFGHTVLVLGGLIAILVRNRSTRLAALALAALGILVSGSREAAFGWLLIAIIGALSDRRGSWSGRIAELGVIGVMIAAATGLGPLLGWGNVGFLLQPSTTTIGSNLLQGTEVAAGDWWDESWVSVDSREVDIAGQQITAYRIQKNGPEGWLRLQQAVELEPAGRYTVSAWINDVGGDKRPGIQGWGQLAGDPSSPAFMLSAALTGGSWRGSIAGPGRLVDTGIADRDGAWKRVYATFDFDGTEPVAWFVGLAPDARAQAGSETEFAGFQMERGGLGPYEPGAATRGLSLATARVPFWRAAWEGIVEKPLAGWGASGYSEYFTDVWPQRSRVQVVPAHAHNMFFQAWFERGVFGLTGILLFLGILVGPALARWDIPLLALLMATIVVNLFDTTLLHGGVFYPLTAIAGWRLGAATKASREYSHAARSFVARLGLAMADTVTGAVALFIGIGSVTYLSEILGLTALSRGFTSPLGYAVLLWPLLSWREGLYPGYGLTPQQELKKQATVTLYAALVLMAASMLLPAYFPISMPALLAAGFGSFFALPAGRAMAKRFLHAAGVWGRPVVLFGAGETGSRIARSLLRRPLDGLHPVAFFDDDRSVHGSTIHGVPVEGNLHEARRYAAANGIDHAIVAIPALSAERLRDLLDKRGRTFKIVQYVPSLAGLPAEDVYASNLDGMLAIEVRNNLASRRNRVLKRTIDLVGSAIGLVLISPVLLFLGTWIRLDTRGPAVYRSERIGENGEVFECLKFRTMVTDADEQLAEIMARDTSVREEYERFHKLDDDPRITGAGRFIRTYSLDELPQLFNVLMGQMSLVGPRPYMTREKPMMSSYGEVILQAKPGMTGYWQVSQRNDVTFRDRLEMEAHYVRNWSIWWDMVILARTPPAVLEKRGK